MHIKQALFPSIGVLQAVFHFPRIFFSNYILKVERWTIGNQSLINVRDFTSAKELAFFINMLNDNDELYYSYFDWKQYGISPQYQRLLDHCIFFAECRFACFNLCTKFPQIVQTTCRDTKHQRTKFVKNIE